MEIDVGAARLSTLENGFPDCHPIEENTCPHFLNSCENDLPRALKIFTSFNRFGVIYRLGTTISISLFLETAIRYSSKSKIFLLLGAKRKKGEVKREHGFGFLYPPAHRLLRATTRVTRASRLRSPSVRFIVVSTNTGLFSAVENFSGHERRGCHQTISKIFILPVEFAATKVDDWPRQQTEDMNCVASSPSWPEAMSGLVNLNDRAGMGKALWYTKT